jgi:hypothetical protein
MNVAASIPLGILSLLAVTGSVSAQTVREQLKDPKFRFYTVIFGVTVGTDSKLQSFRVSKVTDPKTRTTDPVDVQVPQAYIDAARKKYDAKRHEPKLKDGKPVEFFTYFYFTPAHPATVITDLDQSIDKQP